MRLGIIRCAKEEAKCGTTSCLAAIKNREGVFKNFKKVTLFGVLSCGSCPGKKVAIRARRMLKEEGIDKVLIADCISNREGNCPWSDNILNSVEELIGEKKLLSLDNSKGGNLGECWRS